MNNKDFKLLTSIYQNCQTAILSIQDIEPQVEDENLRAELREEKERYSDFLFLCKEIAERENKELPDNSMFEKARLWTSIKMTTIFDNSTRHLAEMLLLGTVMGTLQCYKDMCDYNKADKELLELCGKLLLIEEKHFNFLKLFLKDLNN